MLDRNKFKMLGNDMDVARMWPEKDHPLEVGDSVEGEYVDRKEKVGRHESNVYIIETKDGERVGVWGSTVIDKNMENVAVGSQVGFEYAGERTGKNGTYKDFRIGVVDDLMGEEPLPEKHQL